MTFFSLPAVAKRALANYLRDKPTGTIIKRGAKLKVASDEGATGSYVLKNSYIKLNKDIYALGQIIGKGAFATVKYVESFSTNALYAVKIQHAQSDNCRLENIENEVNTLYDLGLYHDAGLRKGDKDTKHEGYIIHYIVMRYVGLSLDKYLTTYPVLNSVRRFDLAIKLCWALHNLHNGGGSRTGITYAHRDIKPANIALSAMGQLQLIDMGICEMDPDRLPRNCSGGAAYQPNLMTLLEHHVTLRGMDLIALKRVIYMPDKILCGQGYKEDNSGQHFGLPMLCSQDLLKSTGLFKYFDTSATAEQNTMHGDNLDGNPLTLACLLVLGRYGLVKLYAQKVIKNQTLAYAVLGMYFANQGSSDKHLGEQIAFAIKAYVLCKVVRRYEASAEKTKLLGLLVASGITNDLNRALENRVLIGLIRGDSPSVRQATVLLWQTGFCAPTFLNQLKDNVSLAKRVIQLVFDGDLVGVKKELSLRAKSAKQSATGLDLSQLSLVPVLPRLPALVTKNALTTQSVAAHETSAFQSTRKLPPLFFTHKVEHKEAVASVVVHAALS